MKISSSTTIVDSTFTARGSRRVFVHFLKMKLALSVLAFVIGMVGAQWTLPDGAELIVGNIKTGFSCENRIYGYYADVDNDCLIFHICLPVPDDAGNLIETAQYDFVCGNQTVFDQVNLVCAHFNDALPCQQAPSLYDEVNRNFGIIPPRK